MTTQDSARLALAGCIVFLLLAFGLRTVVQWRRTGSTGFVGISGRPGSAEWTGGVLFVVALVAGVAAPLLQLMGMMAPLPALNTPWLRTTGITCYLLGVLATLWAQFAMGDSWRIGVDTGARTTLVQAGPFRWVRNPIFTAMSAATLGLALVVPNFVALLSIVTLVTALEVQVRLVEEPYLMRTHGEDYRRYAAGTGRFVPGIGRLETEPERRCTQ
jgi:protein-S-isoprenylcysteine O-methyltransferase Ste14